jgi:hypothetical protein
MTGSINKGFHLNKKHPRKVSSEMVGKERYLLYFRFQGINF